MLAERLREAGHDVGVSAVAGRRERALDAVLGLERLVFRTGDAASLAWRTDVFEWQAARAPDLVIDLAGDAQPAARVAPLATLLFEGRTDLSAAAGILGRGGLPTLEILLDGQPHAAAAPMADSRVFIGNALEDILARAITLVLAMVSRLERGERGPFLPGGATAQGRSEAGTLAGAFVLSTVPRLGRRALERLRYAPSHWRVGYRFHDGPGVAETGDLSGPAWHILPDDGRRFYADPFPLAWEGRHFIFLEELVHGTGKGVLSVASCEGEGAFGVPRPVLEEPFHLSYPQVFHREGAHWMIPETGSGRMVALYRAERFPDRWRRHTVLIEGRDIFDATLFDHAGLLWMIGTETDGAGSPSDTMVVFFAERMEGPWRDHPLNPILIDRRAARPGGAIARTGDGRLLLPVQDGTLRYGGGLGLCEILALDPDRIELSAPAPVNASGWPHPQIHTLNRAGRLETIDGLAWVPRRRR